MEYVEKWEINDEINLFIYDWDYLSDQFKFCFSHLFCSQSMDLLG